MGVALDGESKRGGVPPVLARLRGAEEEPRGLSVMVGGAYAYSGSARGLRIGCCVLIGPGAGGGGRLGIRLTDCAAPGGFGAGLFGTRLPLIWAGFGEAMPGDVMLRGIGGGARGFSKLSRSFRGNRGLWGGLMSGCSAPVLGVTAAW
jgi:hypothetical protein